MSILVDVFRTCSERSAVRIVSNLYTYMYIQQQFAAQL
jgi:hypothetical protein